MVPDPDPPFDAVAAAKELDDMLADSGVGSAPASMQDTNEYIANLEAEITELTTLVAQKDALLKRATERADQAHAEIAAAGRRLAAASAKDLAGRTRGLLEGFLSVVDDLDRGITAAKQHAESADVVTGLELVRRSFLSRLGEHGVKHVPARGAVFDPQRHDALALVPVTDPRQDGRVIDVMREGYAIGDDTLRPAGVAVGKHGR